MTITINRAATRLASETSYAAGVTDWKLSGACAGRDPSWWDLDGPTDTAGNRAARRVCRSCPFQRTCLKAAFDEGAQGVMRGGRRFPERELAEGMRLCRREACLAPYKPKGRRAAYCGTACADIAYSEQKASSQARRKALARAAA